jgi:heat shock protein HtpX
MDDMPAGGYRKGKVRPRDRPEEGKMRNRIKTVVLLGALTGIVMGIGALVAPGQLPLFVALAAAMNLGAWYFSDRIVLRLSGAREVSPAQAPDLHGMVAELAGRAALPMPRLYVIPDAQPNAFATGRSPSRAAVAVTEGILEALDRRELRAVLAHELAHVAHRDTLVASVAAAAAGVVSWVAHALTFGALFGGHGDEEGEGSGAGALLVALVAPFAATLIQMGISRSREFLADEGGARISGDPMALASALRRLDALAGRIPSAAPPATASLYVVNPFAGVERAARWFSTHPSTAERVERLVALAEGRSVRPSGAGRPATTRGY